MRAVACEYENIPREGGVRKKETPDLWANVYKTGSLLRQKKEKERN